MEIKCIKGETELNRAWIYDNDGEIIGETNFTVSDDFIEKVYKEKYKDEYESLNDFLDWYEPETEGEYIYQRAIQENALIQDLGECIYGTIKIF